VSGLLLDTHALLWFVSNDASLSTTARALIEGVNEVHISVASAWETAIKVSLGKLVLDAPDVESFFVEQMLANAFVYLPIAPSHVFFAGILPLHHRDPFDRLLIAQALAEDLLLVTREDFIAYGVATSW
jgi:PIN domain nuclease of toxin-antitoxin system